MSKLAIVTRASSGIGAAFAQRLTADRYDLEVVGRRADRLEDLAASFTGTSVQPVVADLSTDDGVPEVAELCTSLPLTMLANNAGVPYPQPDHVCCREFVRPTVRMALWRIGRSRQNRYRTGPGTFG